MRPTKLLGRCHHDEGGQLSIISLVVILGVMIFLCMVVNAAHIIRHKLEAQNAADAIAKATTVHLARGMNAVTAANHIIGELQALVVLHHALGGDDLDENNDRDRTPSDYQSKLDSNYYEASILSSGAPKVLMPLEDAYEELSNKVVVEAAIGDSRLQLKRTLINAYQAHALSAALYQGRWIPYIGLIFQAVGGVGMASAVTIEAKTWQEWITLDAMELLAKGLVPLKQLVRDAMIPVIYRYSQAQLLATPLRAEEAAFELGDYHLTRGSLFPGVRRNVSYPPLQLPISQEPERFPAKQLWRSQLVRSSVPWIHYWRLGFLEFGDNYLLLSRFKSYYVKHTQEMALSLASRAKRQKSIHLLILDDLEIQSQDKGDEPWAKASGSRRADQLFGYMGFATRPRPFLAAPAYFEEPNADGIAAYAQGMIYNANPQRPSTTPPQCQKEVGWDTLNWLGQQVPEWERGQDPAPAGNTDTAYFRMRAPEPRIRLNWQQLLVPSTRVADSVLWQRGDLGTIMRRTAVETGAARTH